MLSRLDEYSKVLMVTSGMPQEGKSFVSLNLAFAFSNNGAKVLLVDGDLRRGNLSRALNQRSGIGLIDLLRGVPADSSHRTLNQPILEELGSSAAYRRVNEVPGLVFMPAGRLL